MVKVVFFMQVVPVVVVKTPVGRPELLVAESEVPLADNMCRIVKTAQFVCQGPEVGVQPAWLQGFDGAGDAGVNGVPGSGMTCHNLELQSPARARDAQTVQASSILEPKMANFYSSAQALKKYTAQKIGFWSKIKNNQSQGSQKARLWFQSRYRCLYLPVRSAPLVGEHDSCE